MVKATLKFSGYTLPKGAYVIPHIYSAHMDPRAWKDPHVFSPDRWIGTDGKLLKHSAFIPFSVGKLHLTPI